MAEDADPEIAAAPAKLAQQDAGSVGNAVGWPAILSSSGARLPPSLPIGDSDFTVYTGELFLAMLLEADSRPFDEILATAWRAAGEEGFREDRTGEPPSEDDVSWAIHDTSNQCRALGLLTVGTDWRDRSYGLTETGKATALEALRARATGPRTIP